MRVKSSIKQLRAKLIGAQVKVSSKLGISLSTFAAMVVAMPITAFAFDTNAMISGIKTGMKQIWQVETAVVVPIAVVMIGIIAFQFFFGGEQGVQKAKKSFLYAVIGIAVAYLAPLIGVTIASWFQNTDTGGAFD